MCLIRIVFGKGGYILSNEEDINDFGQYKVIGQFDNIGIKKLACRELKDIIRDYYKIISHYSKRNIQIYYGYANEKEANDYFDDKEWAYQFVSFVDLKKTNISKFKSCFKNMESNTKALYLETLDRYSFIVLVKGKSIQACFDFIFKIASLNLDNCWNYTNSIIMLNQYQEYIEYADSEEKIDVSINFQIQNLEKYKQIVNKLKSYVKEYLGVEIKEVNFLGNTDYHISFSKPLVIKKFFELYFNDNLLDNILKNHEAVKVHTLLYPRSKQLKENNYSHDERHDSENLDIDKYLKQLTALQEKYLKNNPQDQEYEIVSSILKIINVLHEINDFDANNKYIYRIILPVLYECVLQLQIRNNKENLYDALQEINLSLFSLLNNNLDTGHGDYDTPILYYTPIKLIGFYYNFLRKIRDILSDIQKNDSEKDIRYEFLITPKFKNAVSVNTFTGHPQDFKDRLLSISMPVYHLFDISTSLVALIHECGHFLPDSNLRARQDRMSCLISSLVIIVSKEIIRGIYGDILTEHSLTALANFANQMNSELLSSVYNEESKDKYYLENSEKLVRNQLIKFVKRNKYVLISKLEAKEESTFSTEKVQLTVDTNITNLLDYFYSYSIHQMYLNMERIARECFSDLFAIHLLKLDFKSFKKSICNLLENKDTSPFFNTRIAYDIIATGWIEEAKDNKFNDEIIEIIEVYQDYEKFSNHSVKLSIIPGFHDFEVFKRFCDYLNICNDNLNKVFSDIPEIEPLRNTFNSLENSMSVSSIIETIHNFEDTSIDSLNKLYEKAEKFE